LGIKVLSPSLDAEAVLDQDGDAEENQSLYGHGKEILAHHVPRQRRAESILTWTHSETSCQKKQTQKNTAIVSLLGLDMVYKLHFITFDSENEILFRGKHILMLFHGNDPGHVMSTKRCHFDLGPKPNQHQRLFKQDLGENS